MFVSGLRTLLGFGMNFLKNLMEPKNDWSSVLEDGFGQMQIASSLSGHMV